MAVQQLLLTNMATNLNIRCTPEVHQVSVFSLSNKKTFLSPREHYKLKLTTDQLNDLAHMVAICIASVDESASDELEIETLVLAECHKLFTAKSRLQSHHVSFKMSRLLAKVLFVWLNDFPFTNAYYHLAVNVVKQLDEQLVSNKYQPIII